MKNFRDVKDQDRLIERLREDIAKHQMKHAYLFIGPKGVGKRTVAQAFAKTIFCGQKGDACDDCDTCRILEHDNHPDFYWMRPEAGKDYRIDAIREMQRTMPYKPVAGDYRIILLDEAEKLGSTCGNALLKSIEEPPEGTIFLLVSSSLDALLPTIVSRCQIMRLSPLTPETVAELFVSDYGMDQKQAVMLAGLSSQSMEAADYAAEADEMMEWLDFTEIDRTVRERPHELWEMTQSLEKVERLTQVIGYWRKLLRDALVRSIDKEIKPMLDRKEPVWDEEYILTALDLMSETITALEQRANKRMTVDVLLQKLRKATNV
jgi:DNA polymerase-3 subunit delta'